MLVLGIESSCDETGVALYDSDLGLLSHALHSQMETHSQHGGVVPELASRDHIRYLVPLLDEVLKEAQLKKNRFGCGGLYSGSRVSRLFIGRGLFC